MFRRFVRILGLPLLIFLIPYTGDALLMARPPGVARQVWVFVDPPIHGLLALLVALPLLIESLRPSLANGAAKRGAEPDVVGGTSRLWAVSAVLMSAILIDVDHFIAARSLSLDAALTLPMRPPSHSLTLALAVFCLAVLASRRLTFGYLLFAGLASHVLRDASGGATPFLWPLPGYSLPWPIAGCGLLLLYFGAWAIAHRRQLKHSSLPSQPASGAHTADKIRCATSCTGASVEITKKPW